MALIPLPRDPFTRPLPPGAAGPSLAWPLTAAAIARLVYGVDSMIHGSPQMLAAGGRPFTTGWGVVVITANLLALAGVAISASSGWRRESVELIGSIAVVALTAGFIVAVAWNATHTLPEQGLVVAWQQPALAALPAWRIANIARNRRRARLPAS